MAETRLGKKKRGTGHQINLTTIIELKKIGIEEIPEIQKIAYGTWPNTFGKIMPTEQINYMLELIYNDTALKSQMNDKGHQFIIA